MIVEEVTEHQKLRIYYINMVLDTPGLLKRSEMLTFLLKCLNKDL